MQIILENLILMEKQEKRDKDNNLVFEFVCFQKGYKNLIPGSVDYKSAARYTGNWIVFRGR